MSALSLKTGSTGSRHYGLVFAFLAIFFWSTVATAFKLSLSKIGFLPLVFYSAFVSMLVLGVLCLARGKFPQLKAWKKSDYMRSIGLGLLNPALYYLVLFRAYELLPAQEAQVLNFTWPIVLTLLGAVYLGQRLSTASVKAMLVSFLGVVIIATRGDVLGMQFSNSTGVALALISTLIWAFYWLINQTERRDPLLRLFVNFVAGVAWMVIFMSISGQWQIPVVEALAGALYIGLFEMSLAYFCWFQALRLSENISLLNNMIFLTPFGSLLVILLVLKEPIYPSTLIGLMLIITSIVLQKLVSKNSADKTQGTG
jgi:drug/metabolite transporter (DMT)-like permease